MTKCFPDSVSGGRRLVQVLAPVLSGAEADRPDHPELGEAGGSFRKAGPERRSPPARGALSGMTGHPCSGFFFTSMRRLWGCPGPPSGFGRVTVRTPSLNSAVTLSGSTSKGTV